MMFLLSSGGTWPVAECSRVVVPSLFSISFLSLFYCSLLYSAAYTSIRVPGQGTESFPHASLRAPRTTGSTSAPTPTASQAEPADLSSCSATCSIISISLDACMYAHTPACRAKDSRTGVGQASIATHRTGFQCLLSLWINPNACSHGQSISTSSTRTPDVSASRTNRGSSWSSTGHPWRIAARAAPTHKRGPARATATGVRTTAQTISLLSLLQQGAGNLSDFTRAKGVPTLVPRISIPTNS